MGVTRLDLAGTASEHLLHRLVDYFEVDLSFLRRNDHDLGCHGAGRRMAAAAGYSRCRTRSGSSYFAGADPTFAALETPVIGADHPAQPMTSEYQDRVRQGSGIQGVSLATVPLLTSEGTTGTLGFIKFGDREWQHDEINALQAVAALLAQLQARVAAEERLRYLAYHDELTTPRHPPRVDRPPHGTAPSRAPPARSP